MDTSANTSYDQSCFCHSSRNTLLEQDKPCYKVCSVSQNYKTIKIGGQMPPKASGMPRPDPPNALRRSASNPDGAMPVINPIILPRGSPQHYLERCLTDTAHQLARSYDTHFRSLVNHWDEMLRTTIHNTTEMARAESANSCGVGGIEKTLEGM